MQVTVIEYGSRGKVRQFRAKGWHIRQKAIRRERRRLPVITLALKGIL
jgi:hypothetical protein